MTWLVTGGAGYIGSHVVRAFTDAGIEVVVLDSLESGHREFVPADVPFVEGNVTDTALVRTVLRDHGVVGVVQVRHLVFGGESPVLIAGPCSVESEAMILETAAAVRNADTR